MPAPKGHPPYPGCETGGRPKRFTTEFIEAEAEAFEGWSKRKDVLWYEDFASERGYCPSNLSVWAKENEKFRQAYTRMYFWQKSLLVRGGLLNKFNSSVTRILLNKFGFEEQPKIVNVVGGDTVDARIKKQDGSTKDLVDESRPTS